jgi:predicted molibdopterin-dependent oxidoreductase YjgC
LFGWQANNSPDRLTAPLIRKGNRLVETDWNTAMELVVRRSRELLAEQGPSALAFYTTGQLFLEEYYTLAVIAHGAVGTNHVDGNTRLCTATAAEALKESFACDGQPGSYSDVDHADVIALYGHNVAETQTVLWMRMLDRLAGPNPPAVICVDPRETPVAQKATVHLAPLPGTNVALMNGSCTRSSATTGWITTTSQPIPSASMSWPNRSAITHLSGLRRSARWRCSGSARQPASSAPRSACCPPSCRVFTSRTRRPRLRCR